MMIAKRKHHDANTFQSSSQSLGLAALAWMVVLCLNVLPFASANPANTLEKLQSEKLCRKSKIEEIEERAKEIVSNSEEKTDVDTLISNMVRARNSDLYRQIMEDCVYYIKEYDNWAEIVCEKPVQDDFPVGDMFAVGPIHMDAGWLIAAELFHSNNFRSSTPLIPCSDKCYQRELANDCQSSASSSGTNKVGIQADVSGITFLSEEEQFNQDDKKNLLCEYGLLELDRAYQSMRVCAAESNVARLMRSGNDNKNNPKTTTSRSSTNGIIVSEELKIASGVAKEMEKQRLSQADCFPSFCGRYGAEQDSAGFDPESGSIPSVLNDDYVEIHSDSAAPILRSSKWQILLLEGSTVLLGGLALLM